MTKFKERVWLLVLRCRVGLRWRKREFNKINETQRWWWWCLCYIFFLYSIFRVPILSKDDTHWGIQLVAMFDILLLTFCIHLIFYIEHINQCIFFLIYKRTEIWECFWKWGMEWLSMYLYILSDGCFELQWERIKEKQKLGVVRKGSCFMISHHKTTRYLTSYFFLCIGLCTFCLLSNFSFSHPSEFTFFSSLLTTQNKTKNMVWMMTDNTFFFLGVNDTLNPFI